MLILPFLGCWPCWWVWSGFIVAVTCFESVSPMQPRPRTRDSPTSASQCWDYRCAPPHPAHWFWFAAPKWHNDLIVISHPRCMSLKIRFFSSFPHLVFVHLVCSVFQTGSCYLGLELVICASPIARITGMNPGPSSLLIVSFDAQIKVELTDLFLLLLMLLVSHLRIFGQNLSPGFFVCSKSPVFYCCGLSICRTYVLKFNSLWWH
jgi:hypothetical protein